MIVYTAIFNGYDYPPPRPLSSDQHVLFTDTPLSVVGWEQVLVTRQFENPARENRSFKLQPHKLFPGEVTLYMDGNSVPRKSPNEIADTLYSGDPTAVVHTLASQINATLSSEFAWIRSKGIVAPNVLEAQVERYASLPDFPTAECRLLLSRPGCEAFYDVWWNEVRQFGHRDQPALVYAEVTTGTRVYRWPGNRRELLSLKAHRRPQLRGAA